MMNLNKNNGSIEFENFIIKPTDKYQDLKKAFLEKNLELWFENNNWITYRLDVSMNFIIIIKLFNDNLRAIEIFPKIEIGNKNENGLKSILQNLGGENNYRWGNVELNKDKKAGYESVLINFLLEIEQCLFNEKNIK